MSIDVDRLAETMVRGAQLLIEKAVAPLREESQALRRELAAAAARIVELEARAPIAGPEGPPGRDGVDGKDGAPGRDGIDGKDGAPGERGADGPAGRDGIDGRDGVDGKDGVDGAPGLNGKDGADGKDGAPGLNGKDGVDGKDGAPGMLPIVKDWSDRVHYAGECVAALGGTWQARQDTGHAPPHNDWIALAVRGADGANGRSFEVRGTWSADDEYRALDVVAKDGASFVALSDNPGECPGPKWQMLSMRGKTGQKGDAGSVGPRGERGPAIISAIRDGGVIVFTDDAGDTFEADWR